jgi:prenyl protein peptidase
MSGAFATVLTTVAYDLAIVLLLYTHRFIYPSISRKLYRFIAFGACALVCGFLILWLGYDFHLFHCYGFSSLSLIATVSLFLGPLVQDYFSDGYLALPKLEIARQLVVAPIGEEVIYRAFTCTYWERGGLSAFAIIFVSPVLFGLSHFHHFFLGIGSAARRLAESLFQCGFTTVFGWWVAFLWYRSHDFLLVGAAHCFCNWMRFPNFSGAFHWEEPRQRRIILAAYVAGVVAFVLLCRTLIRYDVFR